MEYTHFGLVFDTTDSVIGLRLKAAFINKIGDRIKVDLLDLLLENYYVSKLYKGLKNKALKDFYKKLSFDSFCQYLLETGFSGRFESFRYLRGKEFSDTKAKYYSFVYDVLKEHSSEMSSDFMWLLNSPIKKTNVTYYNLSISKQEAIPFLSVDEQAKETELFIDYTFNEKVLSENVLNLGGKILIHENLIILASKPRFITQFYRKYPLGFAKLTEDNKAELLSEFIIPLCQKNEVQLPKVFNQDSENQPHTELFVREFMADFLMLIPKYHYGNEVVEYNDGKNIFIKNGNVQKLVNRNIVFEKEFYKKVQALHPSFSKQLTNTYFYLPFKDVLKEKWFVKVTEQLNKDSTVVSGVSELKHFKLNRTNPKLAIQIVNTAEWFEIKLIVNWDKEEVSLRDLRTAFIANQKFVTLKDGTLGILPDEWLDKYNLIIKLSKFEEGVLKLSNRHIALIEPLIEDIEDIQSKETLLNASLKVQNPSKLVGISPQIKATLRPYQQEGYEWMQKLYHAGWGGCLADDMGLGKTLQTITFLQFTIDQNPNLTHLIVTPVSLVFNWENELKKFAPNIKFHIYQGANRTMSESHFEDHNLVITSYGTVRSEIELLSTFKWNYIILDESHAIKNPAASTTRALELLQSDNKLILSGTPLQNNTFDLYSQFNFINPGMLGSKEIFKEHFADEIDKNGNAEKSAQLKQIIEPFILRRTKEQVAQDLPEKTETVLWCQMGAEQRAVYDNLRKGFVKTIFTKMNEEGKEKSTMHLLEALLRLRQICDDLRLIPGYKNAETIGIKIEELFREIQENVSNHKMLVFSQFVDMLGLIRQKLEDENISFCYLDGSTPVEKRKEEVEAFQKNVDKKVFLISLKAGGVGLNLTEADYVYIVDPWWNPAAEQQAIDRAHRIGQKKPVFAYKMICKDTVEEKIMKLQEKKLQLAKDLISNEAGFFKSLSKEEIEYLFS